jgi:hypothetical protein
VNGLNYMVCPHMGLIPLAFLSNEIDPYEGQSEKKTHDKGKFK